MCFVSEAEGAGICSIIRKAECADYSTKVKCNVALGGSPCARCKNRGLSCTVNKSLQTLLEDDASYAVKSP
jgi:hypothetical protein